MNVSKPELFNQYLKKLEAVSNLSISSFDDFLYALQSRHDFFASAGCSVSDHGLEELYAEDFTGSEIDSIFNKIHGGKQLSETEVRDILYNQKLNVNLRNFIKSLRKNSYIKIRN